MRNAMYLLRRHHSTVISVFALVIALTSAGAWAGTVLVGSKQIRNGSILTQDIHKNAVKTTDIGSNAVGSSDIKTGAVDSSDIGEGQVLPQDVTMPDPAQLQEGDTASAVVGGDFGLVDQVGTYTKGDPTSALEVDWTGTAAAGEINCVFQLRVDGQASANGAGLVFVASQTESTTSVSATALFDGLGPGPHHIEVWARLTGSGPSTCTVGPGSAGIGQTFVVSELVV